MVCSCFTRKGWWIGLHSEAMSDEEFDVGLVVRETIEEARRVLGGGPSFAERLAEVGVGPGGGHYSQSAVSNWVKGRTMPPADVLVASAGLTGISLDPRILATFTDGRDGTDWRTAVGDLQKQVDALTAQLLEICSRLAIPVPVAPPARDGGTDRAIG